MPIDLRLLDGVRWQGRTVVGARAQALLAALVLDGRTVTTDRLVAEVWGEDEPANPAKALQVLVSRTRAVVGPGALVTDGNGYRLDIATDRVDAALLHRLAGRARALLAEDPVAAATAAGEALELGAGASWSEGEGPLAEVRRRAEDDLGCARVVLAQARSRGGDHDLALAELEKAAEAAPEDETLLADVLRSEAVVRGPGAALDRFELHRSDLRERLGADVGPELRRVHGELLALDSPVRAGVRFDATALLGRDDDLRRVRALLATSRVVSILGPGGLGKTRLAHVVAREAPQPVVHFVELAGVIAPQDLVGEVGSALGVRDSVTGRRTLTAQQRADVRSRIAHQLDRAPTLLVLDNCEHLVEAAADLVAHLVASTRELRVLTTTRSPLAIAAEHVYQLPQLSTGDAVELFRDRATAARPSVVLREEDVRAVVDRLDGLPLAIELAAAKVRVMSPAEISHRLADRFALLRGGDRSAPSRHQTLLAVIDWSWSLLGERVRRALRRLSAFPDGFSLHAAEQVLDDGALGDIEELAEQSLLTVTEAADGVRYRMLETVREFGRLRLEAADESAEARAAVRKWAVGHADRNGAGLYSPEQLDAMDRLRAEETNLADVLREALADTDQEAVVLLFSALGGYWTITGDHSRGIALAPAVAAALDGWTPPPALLDRTRVALSIALASAVFIGSAAEVTILERLLTAVGSDSASPTIRAMVTVLLATVSPDAKRWEELAGDPDPMIRAFTLQWISATRENAGDPVGAIEAAQAALDLIGDDVGPWHRALLHSQLFSLHEHLGDFASAARHAAEALPVLDRLGAVEDSFQIRALLATAALVENRRDDAARIVDDLEDRASRATAGEIVSVIMGRAQLAIVDGDIATGLRLHREAAEAWGKLRFPSAPDAGNLWTILGEAVALSAFAQYGDGDGDDGADLFESLKANAQHDFDTEHLYRDYPVAGMALAALGIWGLLKGAMPAEEAIRLLVLADRFAYNRFTSTMQWPVLRAHAERAVPGLVSLIEAEYGERRGPDLLAEARAVLKRVI